MNLQNGTLDTRLPQNIIRNFKIPANVEHGKLNPFKIGGGNAIWATYFPPNVKVWFSTNPNFDGAQRLDYMNRGMRYNSIGKDGLIQQYDNFYIFTEGTWDDVIKIAVSTQGDIVEPILSSNTGDIDSVGRVASIQKMPINGASGYNEPDFEFSLYQKWALGSSFLPKNNLFALKYPVNFFSPVASKKYLLEVFFHSIPIMIDRNVYAVRSQTHLGILKSGYPAPAFVLESGASGKGNVFNGELLNVTSANSTRSFESLVECSTIIFGTSNSISATNTAGQAPGDSAFFDTINNNFIVSGELLRSGTLAIFIEKYAESEFAFLINSNIKIYSL